MLPTAAEYRADRAAVSASKSFMFTSRPTKNRFEAVLLALLFRKDFILSGELKRAGSPVAPVIDNVESFLRMDPRQRPRSGAGRYHQ